MAVVIDGSESIGVDNFEVAKEFAKDTVAAFADKNLFENGGTASFVQFSDSAESGGPFFSQEAYDYYVDRQEHINGSTDIASGIEAGRERLALAPEATVAFMVIMTDGNGDVAVRFGSVGVVWLPCAVDQYDHNQPPPGSSSYPVPLLSFLSLYALAHNVHFFRMKQTQLGRRAPSCTP